MLKKNAFTLAEVLLTLSIIGIVAAMTIPALMTNVKNADSVAKLRKAQSTMQQAVKIYMANNGISDLSTAGIFTGSNQSSNVWNAFKPYLNVIKDCGTATGQGCFAKGVTYKFINGSNNYAIDNDTNAVKAVLADGISVYINDYNGNCNEDKSLTGTGLLYLTACAEVDFDVNGQNGPNQFGMDYFAFRLTKNGMLYPTGMDNDIVYGCSRTLGAPQGWGTGCTAKVVKEGAINY